MNSRFTWNEQAESFKPIMETTMEKTAEKKERKQRPALSQELASMIRIERIMTALPDSDQKSVAAWFKRKYASLGD